MPCLFPVHKLFPGPECLFDAASASQQLPCFAYHGHEKRRRIPTDAPDNPGVVNFGSIVFGKEQTPLLLDARKTQDHVHIERIGASFLMQPVSSLQLT